MRLIGQAGVSQAKSGGEYWRQRDSMWDGHCESGGEAPCTPLSLGLSHWTLTSKAAFVTWCGRNVPEDEECALTTGFGLAKLFVTCMEPSLPPAPMVRPALRSGGSPAFPDSLPIFSHKGSSPTNPLSIESHICVCFPERADSHKQEVLQKLRGLILISGESVRAELLFLFHRRGDKCSAKS